VYHKAGHDELAAQYSEMSAKYHQRAGEPVPDYAGRAESAPAGVEAASSPEPTPTPMEASAQAPAPVTQPAAPAVPPTKSSEDNVDEWEAMIAVEPPKSTAGRHFLGKQAVGDVVGDLLEEIRFYISQGMWEEAQAATEKCTALAPGIPELDEFRQQIERADSTASAPEVELVEEGSPAEPTVATLVFDSSALGMEEELSPQPEPAGHNEDSVTEVPLPPPAASEPVAVAQDAAPPAGDDAIADMVFTLEKSLEPDFEVSPAAASAAPATPEPPAATPPPRRPVDVTPRAVPPEPVAIPMVPVSAATVVAAQPVAQPQPGATLSDVFEEFKEDMEGDSAAAEEQDPETHYNLGVAFKEMGLLEEAIGELQKVCHAIDHGHPFPHVLQVYTWLAECLVNKGAPQAAIKWYQRAANLPAMDEESRMAVYYEMAAAYEVAGNRKEALDNFMEVYANNIDYRDVAERIKTLKA